MRTLIALLKYHWFMLKVEWEFKKYDYLFLLTPIFVISGCLTTILVAASRGHVGATLWLNYDQWTMRLSTFGLFVSIIGGFLLILGHYIDLRGSLLTVLLGLLIAFFGVWGHIMPAMTFFCGVGVLVIIYGGSPSVWNEHRLAFIITGIVLILIGWLGSPIIPTCPESFWDKNYDLDEMEYYKDSKYSIWQPHILKYEFDENGEVKTVPSSGLNHPTVQGPKDKAEKIIKLYVAWSNKKAEQEKDFYLEWTGWESVRVPPIIRAREGDPGATRKWPHENKEYYTPDLKYDWDL